MLSLELVPGVSLGKFYLGMPISEVIQYFIKYNERSFTSQINKVEILYDQKDPLSTDILIRLVEDGILFRFEPSTQRLKMIEVLELSKSRLLYGNTVFAGPSTDSSFVKIYQVFGPTYPGRFDASENMYNLSYPGITFVFPIPPQYASHYTENQHELPMEFPNGTTPVAVKIYVYEGYDYLKPVLPPIDQIPITLNENQEFELLMKKSENGDEEAELGQGSFQNQHDDDESSMTKTPEIGEGESEMSTTTKTNGSKRPVSKSHYYERLFVKIGKSITFTKRNQTISFGDTAEDVIMKIGAPERVFFKRQDKLKIHAMAANISAHAAKTSLEGTSFHASTSPEGAEHAAVSPEQKANGSTGVPAGIACFNVNQKTAVDYFYNYFSLGVDIMFNGSTHRVNKFVLHTNFPGSRDFNIYLKSNFAIAVSSTNPLISNQFVHSDMKFPEVQRILGEKVPHSKPLVNDYTMSNNPFGGTKFYAYEGCIFEVLKNDYLNSVTLFAL